MKFLGYWGSQEQYSMQDLIRFAIEVEKGGFTATIPIYISSLKQIIESNI
jgi:hypothetical protein